MNVSFADTPDNYIKTLLDGGQLRKRASYVTEDIIELPASE